MAVDQADGNWTAIIYLEAGLGTWNDEDSMSILRRLTTIFQAQANNTLDAVEDPQKMLDVSYERQISLLRDVRRGIVEVTASRRRLELEADQIHTKLDKLSDQARQAIQAGREDLARIALERKQIAQAQLDDFESQIAQLAAEQERLMTSESRLAAAIESFRTRKEVIKAQYSAAQAQARIGEAVSGLSEESADISYSIRRAEEKTARLRSRGEAITELVEAGVLSTSPESRSELDRELERLGREQALEAELTELKRELVAPAEPKQLESGQ